MTNKHSDNNTSVWLKVLSKAALWHDSLSFTTSLLTLHVHYMTHDMILSLHLECWPWLALTPHSGSGSGVQCPPLTATRTEAGTGGHRQTTFRQHCHPLPITIISMRQVTYRQHPHCIVTYRRIWTTCSQKVINAFLFCYIKLKLKGWFSLFCFLLRCHGTFFLPWCM